MSRPTGTVLMAALSMISGALALGVTPGSPCASACLDSAQGGGAPLNTSDIVCEDVDYFSSETGARFKKCDECLQTSETVDGSDSDTSRFLYNLRYASATCIFDYPSHRANSTASCDLDTACKPLQTAIETGLGAQPGAADFSYCSADNSAFRGSNIDNCVTCLQSASSSYVANFLVALQAGCEQQPAPGVPLGLSGKIFSEQPVTATSAAGGGGREGLSTPAIAGIAVGATALFVMAIILFAVYWHRQKRYDREDQREAEGVAFYAEKGSGSYLASITSANSTRPTPSLTIDHTAPPPTYAAPGAEGLGINVMNNAEYYDRLEGSMRGRPPMTISAPMQTLVAGDRTNTSNHRRHHSHGQVDTIGQLPTDSLPTHPAYIPRCSSSNSSRATPQPGARPSRNPTPASVRSSTQWSSAWPQHQGGVGNRPDSYAIQAYLNSIEDPGVPEPPPPTAAPSWPHHQHPPPRPAMPASNAEIARNIEIELASAHLHASRATSPDHVSSRGGSPIPPPPRIGSLILPSVPRIRVPGSKKLPPPLPRLEVPDVAGAAITGPLALPDSRFSTRLPPPPPPPPPGQMQGQDRIVKQTVDRGGRSNDVPIASGKSYLYG